MGWPSIAEYNAAFADPGRCLVASSLRGARVKPGPLGLPLPISGGFALIYELALPDGRRKAVRCYTEDDPARRDCAMEACGRLKLALSRRPALRPHFAEALWEQSCVRTASGYFPAMIMDWVEGQTLGAWIEARHKQPRAIAALRESFCALAALLEREGIVHGDLQTGNIIVMPRGTLALIDYDELWFSSDAACAGSDVHVNFQHPAWSTDCDRGRKDRFPAIAIDLGLAAIQTKPDLFDRFSTGENIFFTREDYAEPESSEAFAALAAIPTLARAAELFAGLCGLPPQRTPRLEEFHAALRVGERTRSPSPASKAGTRPISISARHGNKPPRSTVYIGPYPVFDAGDFQKLMSAVGKKIEAVGRVVSLHRGRTKNDKPYMFVNFADWRGDCFSLTIWSDGLASFAEPPGEGWAGRWVSAVGLVDEPYRGERRTGTQLAITIRDASQLRFIAKAEAMRRLGRTDESSTALRRKTPRHKPASTKGRESGFFIFRKASRDFIRRLALVGVIFILIKLVIELVRTGV